MADNDDSSSSSSNGGGQIVSLQAEAQEEQDRVKTKPVSWSTVGGHVSTHKRTIQNLTAEAGSSSEPPAPPKVSKFALNMSNKMATKSNTISIKLGAAKPKLTAQKRPPKKSGLTSIFGDSDDSEPEEMPREAKMRMKNIGRETPTSAGPNSFNKGKQGFSDHQKLWERKLKGEPDDE